jgi:hypothetical protein
VQFSRKHWKGISAQAMEFVRFLMEFDPEVRPTASAALDHPWLCEAGTPFIHEASVTPLAPRVGQTISTGTFSQGDASEKKVFDGFNDMADFVVQHVTAGLKAEEPESIKEC